MTTRGTYFGLIFLYAIGSQGFTILQAWWLGKLWQIYSPYKFSQWRDFDCIIFMPVTQTWSSWWKEQRDPLLRICGMGECLMSLKRPILYRSADVAYVCILLKYNRGNHNSSLNPLHPACKWLTGCLLLVRVVFFILLSTIFITCVLV